MLSNFKNLLTIVLVVTSVPLFAATTDNSEFVVKKTTTFDLKPVIAIVDSVHHSLARARIGGTIDGLSISEGEHVEKGQVIGVVIDPKQPLAIDAIDARLQSLIQERDLAATENKRYLELAKTNTVSTSAIDEVTTKFKVMEHNLAALQAERATLIEQKGEGKILAPLAGRVLTIPVTNGSVVIAGDIIAEIATDDFILRLSIPERHTQYLHKGDEIKIKRQKTNTSITNDYVYGTIRKLYPKLTEGRVIADVSVANLDNYFIGELMTAYIKTANREVFFVPQKYIINRHGLNYVKFKNGQEIVVQLGYNNGTDVEVLAGLQEQDLLVIP